MKKYIYIAALVIGALTGCQKYDAPEVEERAFTPKEGWNQISIEALKAMHDLGAEPNLVEGNVYIRGIIVGDDESGNIYKSIYIQDETGGLNLAVDAVNLYNIMPVGQEVIVELKDMWIGDYRNGYQLGDTVTDPQYGFEMARYDWANEYRKDENGNSLAHFHNIGWPKAENVPAPIEIESKSAILSDMYGSLVVLKNVSIQNAEMGSLTWATAEQTVNRTAFFEDGTSVIVRTSGYSNFYTDLIPTGSGDLVGILAIYGSDTQLYLRDRNDIFLKDE